MPHILSLSSICKKAGHFLDNYIKNDFFEKQHNFLFTKRFHTDLFHEASSSSMFKNIIRVTEIGCCANVPVHAGCVEGS